MPAASRAAFAIPAKVQVFEWILSFIKNQGVTLAKDLDTWSKTLAKIVRD